MLNREIVRHILGSFGLVPPPNFGKVGISSNEFKLNDGFSLEFENANGTMEMVKFGLWGGNINYNQSTMIALATDVCDNDSDYHEFSLVYRVDNSFVHGIKHIYNDNGISLYLNNDKVWKPIGMYDKLIACAGFQKINDLGINWSPNIDSKELLPFLLEIVEM